MSTLEDIRALTTDVSPGPWVVDGFADGDHVRLAAFSGTNQGPVIAADIHNSGDAILIGAAPKLLAALEAVKCLHYSDEAVEGVVPEACSTGSCGHLDDCPEVGVTPCYECSTPGEWYVQWPCPTLRAIAEALA